MLIVSSSFASKEQLTFKQASYKCRLPSLSELKLMKPDELTWSRTQCPRDKYFAYAYGNGLIRYLPKDRKLNYKCKE